jgi:periplasmic copper chaperone A
MNRHRRSNLWTSAAALLCATGVASAHNALSSMYAPAGYTQDLEMRVYHGCKGSPVKAVRIKIPEQVSRVNIEYTRDWEIETRMRKLPKPITMEGGVVINETIDEIIWKNPKSPLPANGRYEAFRFRASLPNTPGAILYFRTINVCEQGDEPYVDLPKAKFDATDDGDAVSVAVPDPGEAGAAAVSVQPAGAEVGAGAGRAAPWSVVHPATAERVSHGM